MQNPQCSTFAQPCPAERKRVKSSMWAAGSALVVFSHAAFWRYLGHSSCMLQLAPQPMFFFLALCEAGQTDIGMSSLPAGCASDPSSPGFQAGAVLAGVVQILGQRVQPMTRSHSQFASNATQHSPPTLAEDRSSGSSFPRMSRGDISRSRRRSMSSCATPS